MMKKLSILGSTGSIGTQALDVCRQNGYVVAGLAANTNSRLLAEQARAFGVPVIAVCDETAYHDLKVSLADTSTRVLLGEEGVCEIASLPGCDTVLNAIVGIAGLHPTMAAIRAKKTLALANKESLVAGGALVMEAARQNGVTILPVDSEHSAIFQCLEGNNRADEVYKIILTASGGPFFGKTRTELCNVTPEQALAHPNWNMGAKITVDSATMMNKGLEIIEAAWLFGVSADKIEVVVHRESVVHSAVEYVDGAVIAQLGVPDMRLPIQYALT
ncbi:MAG: 1-deoxy-D-xylulose-5-phosphate reductoisomerase, partial [Acetanaerobacterium sp.]